MRQKGNNGQATRTLIKYLLRALESSETISQPQKEFLAPTQDLELKIKRGAESIQ